MRRISLVALAAVVLPAAGGQYPAAAQSAPPEAAAVDPSRIYEMEELTQEPELRNPRAMPRALQAAYPSHLRDRGTEGRSVIAIVIEADGTVSDVEVAQPANYPDFDVAALRAARRLRFKPGRIGSTPVRVRAELPIEWTITRPTLPAVTPATRPTRRRYP